MSLTADQLARLDQSLADMWKAALKLRRLDHLRIQRRQAQRPVSDRLNERVADLGEEIETHRKGLCETLGRELGNGLALMVLTRTVIELAERRLVDVHVALIKCETAAVRLSANQQASRHHESEWSRLMDLRFRRVRHLAGLWRVFFANNHTTIDRLTEEGLDAQVRSVVLGTLKRIEVHP